MHYHKKEIFSSVHLEVLFCIFVFTWCSQHKGSNFQSKVLSKPESLHCVCDECDLLAVTGRTVTGLGGPRGAALPLCLTHSCHPWGNSLWDPRFLVRPSETTELKALCGNKTAHGYSSKGFQVHPQYEFLVSDFFFHFFGVFWYNAMGVNPAINAVFQTAFQTLVHNNAI